MSQIDNLRTEIEEVLTQFEEFKQKFEKAPYGSRQKEFFEVMEEFRIFLTNFESIDVANALVHSARYPEYEKFFRHQNDYFMRSIETLESLDLINSTIEKGGNLLDLISGDYLKSRYLQKTHDLRLIDFENVKKMVMVGCGPFPDTVLYLHEKTEVPEIIALDNNEEAIHISSQFISNLGFNRIKFNCVNGSDYDYSDADVVYIAGFVSPKAAVLKQIAETSTNKDVQIIVDSSLGIQNLIFESVNEANLHPRLKIVKKDYSKSKFYKQEMIKIMKYDI